MSDGLQDVDYGTKVGGRMRVGHIYLHKPSGRLFVLDRCQGESGRLRPLDNLDTALKTQGGLSADYELVW